MKAFVQNAKIASATAFWFGNSPLIPGTVGTIPAVILFVLVCRWVPQAFQSLVLAALLLLACVGCVGLGPWAEKHWGRKDPRNFVLDEVAGFLVTVLLFRLPSVGLTIFWAFLATRIFDIIKPPPAARLQVLPAGWGILVDDLIASLYAALCLHLASIILPGLFGL